MKKFIFTICILCLSAGSTFAQVSIGPSVGVNLSNARFSFEESRNEPETNLAVRPRIGMVINAPLGKSASIQPQILYSGKGYAFDIEDIGDDLDGYDRNVIDYVEIPINFVFGAGQPQAQFQFLFGPYLAFAIRAENRYDVSGRIFGQNISEKGSETLDIGNGEDDVYSPIDAGLNVGMGCRFNKVQLQAGYGVGLSNIIPSGNSFSEDNSARNGVIHITFALLFDTAQ